MAETWALLVGIPTGQAAARPLRGVRADLEGWRRRLRAMGTPDAQITRLHHPRTTTDRVLAEVEALARRVHATAEGRGLLILGGHGGGGEGELLRCADGPLRADALAASLEAHLPGRGILTVVDVCAPAGTGGAPLSLRPCDLVMAAAAPGQQAEELEVEGRWHGAWTWALHRVLDRWAQVGPHGALVSISPAVLHQQACLVLQGLGFRQTPTLQGPSALRDLPLGPGTTARPAPLPLGVTRQISPDTDCLVYRIQALAGADLGRLVVTDATFQSTGGYVASREYWQTIPTDGFKLVPTDEGLPTMVPGLAYGQLTFDPSGATHAFSLTAGTGQTLFRLTVGQTEVGYLMRTSGQPVRLDWYMTTSPITPFFPTPSTGLVFSPVTGTAAITAQKRVSS